MELCKDGGNMITWFGVRDETSSGILYSLQWLKGRLRKSREHSIAVVDYQLTVVRPDCPVVYHRLSRCKSVYGTESHAPVITPKRREENII